MYVDDNGNVRELNADEEECVTTAIFPEGEADRYIKSRYESLTPDGRLAGYLRRRQLPPQISIGPPPGNAVTVFYSGGEAEQAGGSDSSPLMLCIQFMK